MATVKVSSKGQIRIPAEIRKRYHIEPGTKINIMEYGSLICLTPSAEDPVTAACGLLPRKPSLSRQLLAERKKDFE